MDKLKFRQVHLDFHTSEAISDIGKSFSTENFQQMLQLGHVDSVTLFAKCWHGWSYYPSKISERHPGLSFDLLGEQIKAAHEIGVRTPIYMTIMPNTVYARKHPGWVKRNKDESLVGAPNFTVPGFYNFCFNTPYLKVVLDQLTEIISTYDADGLFLDGVSPTACYCQNCVASVLERGGNPLNEDIMLLFQEEIYLSYAKQVKEIIDQYKPGLPVFHNAGHVPLGDDDVIQTNTHLELESLPTGGWGYDHFPLSIRYHQNKAIECLGLTGRFHTGWGEFGGFKHPNALRYETSICLANGAKCSIGDQLHPNGKMDAFTYEQIGKVYAEVEEKEEWCVNVENIADVGLLGLEAVGVHKFSYVDYISHTSDLGALRILQECKILFNVIDCKEDFTRYKVLILPDHVLIGEELLQKLNEYIKQGGKILASGESGLSLDKSRFELDFGVRYLRENPYVPHYFKPHVPLKNLSDKTSYVIYSQGHKVEIIDAFELGHGEDPYFNRDAFKFCSHKHTPSSQNNSGPELVHGKDGIYIAWNVFSEYAEVGSLVQKETVEYALNILLGEEKTIETTLPAQGIVTLMHQKLNNRYVNHILYAVPVKRGEDIEIIEDITPLHGIDIKLRFDEKVSCVYLAPQMKKLEYKHEDGILCYTVPVVDCHQMVVVEI